MRMKLDAPRRRKALALALGCALVAPLSAGCAAAPPPAVAPCTSEAELTRRLNGVRNAEAAAFRRSLQALYQAHDATPEEPFAKTTVVHEERGPDRPRFLEQGKVLPADRAPGGERPEGAPVFLAGRPITSFQLAPDYWFARRMDGEVIAIRPRKRVVHPEEVDVCECEVGSGMAETPPPPASQLLYWVRVERAEDVTVVDLPFDEQDLHRDRQPCPNPAP